MRTTHFHSGLDIRTNNQIGAAVRAAQDGYISRASKSSNGYGNVLYVTHPNGHTTLYAHLDLFKGPIATHVQGEQYRNQTFDIDLRFPPGKFRVNRGDTIALSGNTGSSSGPHLHFDLRDENMDAINPLSYGFREIIDRIPPIVQVIALRTMDKDARINGKFGRFEFRAIRSGGKYHIPVPVEARGRIGIELLGYDKMDNSGFQCGINKYIVSANGQQVFTQTIPRIDMENTRGILSVMDYHTLETRGHRYNKLYVEDGNPMDFYSGVIDRGIITVRDQQVQVDIDLSDSYGHTAEALFTLKPGEHKEILPSLDALKAPAGFEKSGHHLIARMPLCKEASLFTNGSAKKIQPDFRSNQWSVFLIDLRSGIPDSLSNCRHTLRFNISERVPSRVPFTYFGPSFSVHFPDSALFDTLYLSASHRLEGKRDVLMISEKTTPLLRAVTVEVKPNGPANTRYSAYRVDDGRYIFQQGTWTNGKLRFSTNYLGKFILLPDSLPPAVHRIHLSRDYARFRIGDNLSGIASFEARVNGEWLLMNYDHKTGVLFSEKPEKGMEIRGDFQLKVTDRSGNVKMYKQKVI
ncbi:MAG: M23 family metallopeptidase [Bacteroidota bacterium]